MIVEEMPIAGVRVLGQGGVVSVERAADVVYDSIQIVERATLLTCKRIIPIEDLNCASNNAVSRLMLMWLRQPRQIDNRHVFVIVFFSFV